MPKHSFEAGIYILLMLVVEWLMRDKAHALQFSIKSKALKITVATVLMLIIELTMGTSSEFIYFQF